MNLSTKTESSASDGVKSVRWGPRLPSEELVAPVGWPKKAAKVIPILAPGATGDLGGSVSVDERVAPRRSIAVWVRKFADILDMNASGDSLVEIGESAQEYVRDVEAAFSCLAYGDADFEALTLLQVASVKLVDMLPEWQGTNDVHVAALRRLAAVVSLDHDDVDALAEILADCGIDPL